MNKKVRELVSANGGQIVGEEYFPLDHADYARTVDNIMSTGSEVVDRAKIAEGRGGPAQMVPGQHHVRMNMYVAQVSNGRLNVVKSLGAIDPKECVRGVK